MKYQIITPPSANLRPLRAHMSEYAIDAKYKASTIMSDGSYSAVPGFPICTVSALTANTVAQAASIAINPVAGVGMMIGGLILDALFNGGKRDAPVPVAQFVEVTWRNVSAARAQWAEYLLCKLCERQGWQIHTDLLDQRNAAYAKRSSRAPTPWRERQKRRKKTGLFDTIMELFK